MEKITEKEIKHLASLSALEFDDAKIKELSKEFEGILGFVEKISNAKFNDVDTFAKVVDFKHLREDEPKESFPVEQVLLNAPKKRKEYFNVPRVVE